MSPDGSPQKYGRLQRKNGIAESKRHPKLSEIGFQCQGWLAARSPDDVAKTLGNTIERHYTPFVKELRDRVRWFFDH
jgi:hypothetical protein